MKPLQFEFINSKLKEVLTNLSKRNSFNRDHIFYDIIELIKNKVSVEQKLKIIYVFSEIEKALSNLKDKENQNTHQVMKVDKIYFDLDNELNHYLSLSYYPMKALYYFEEKEFNKSIECLTVFFDNSNSILGTNPVLLNLACGEQYLNLFRIYSVSENEEGVIKCSANLLLLCYYKLLMSDNDKIINTKSKFSIEFEFDKNEYLFWKVYHTDNIFKRFINHPNDRLLQKIITEVLENINEEKNDFFYKSLKSLYYFYNNDYTKSLSYFLSSLYYFDERSDALFYLNITKISKIISETSMENIIFKNICNDFISKNIIKINNQTKVELLK